MIIYKLKYPRIQNLNSWIFIFINLYIKEYGGYGTIKK